MTQFRGRIPNTNIAIDRCSYDDGEIDYWLVSHAHTDHTFGLNNRWRKGIIHCSEVTKKLLLLRFPDLRSNNTSTNEKNQNKTKSNDNCNSKSSRDNDFFQNKRKCVVVGHPINSSFRINIIASPSRRGIVTKRAKKTSKLLRRHYDANDNPISRSRTKQTNTNQNKTKDKDKTTNSNYHNHLSLTNLHNLQTPPPSSGTTITTTTTSTSTTKTTRSDEPIDSEDEWAMEEENQIEITLIDAHHCPGSVMFLIKDFNHSKTYLYSGDFRLDESMFNNPKLTNIWIDKLWMDVTFCNKGCQFPKKDEILVKLYQYLKEQEQDKKQNVSLDVIYIDAEMLGIEQLLVYLCKKVEFILDCIN